jgi:RimJ/RimL family protein N-acetyltransferase
MYINKYNKYVRKAIYLTGGLLGGSLIGYSTKSYFNKYNTYVDYTISNQQNEKQSIIYNKLIDGFILNTMTIEEETFKNEFSYKLVTYDELVEWLSQNPKLKKSIETCISDLREHKFNIEDLKDENIDKNTLYLFIYNNQEMIASSRLIYSNSHGYINFVYINPIYRGRKICQENIKLLIQLTRYRYNIKIYELDVKTNNISAIKCYENIGFRVIKNTINILHKVQKMKLENMNKIYSIN